jgi:hypothetical protein
VWLDRADGPEQRSTRGVRWRSVQVRERIGATNDDGVRGEGLNAFKVHMRSSKSGYMHDKDRLLSIV